MRNFMTVESAAEHFNLSVRHIRRHITACGIGSDKLGSRQRVIMGPKEIATLAEHIEQGRAEATAAKLITRRRARGAVTADAKPR